MTSGDRPTLSLAMIVRDEEELLGGCLESVRGVADEICVVDTGSQDGTAAVAEAAGAQVAHIAWRDDFSAARNASLDMCAGAWILVLDADEELDPEGGARIRKLAAGPQDRAYSMVTRNYNRTSHWADFQFCAPGDPYARGFAGWRPSRKVRLFPNRKDLRFEGRVHELVEPSLDRVGMPRELTDAPVHHYALLKDEARVRRKFESYLALSMAKIRDHPANPKAYAELGWQYGELGVYREAVRALAQAVKLDPQTAQWYVDLGNYLHLAGRSEEALQALTIGVRLDPQHAQGLGNLAAIQGNLGRWEEAAASFEALLRLEAGHARTRCGLATALAALGRREQAAAEAQAALAMGGGLTDGERVRMERIAAGNGLPETGPEAPGP